MTATVKHVFMKKSEFLLVTSDSHPVTWPSLHWPRGFPQRAPHQGPFCQKRPNPASRTFSLIALGAAGTCPPSCPAAGTCPTSCQQFWRSRKRLRARLMVVFWSFCLYSCFWSSFILLFRLFLSKFGFKLTIFMIICIKKGNPAFAQRCKNVQTCKQCLCKKNPISGKIFAKVYAVLSRKWVMSQFCACWWHFGTLCPFLAFFGTIWIFWAFNPVLSRIRFVVIFTLFQVKYLWLKPYLFLKKCLFAWFAQHSLTWTMRQGASPWHPPCSRLIPFLSTTLQQGGDTSETTKVRVYSSPYQLNNFSLGLRVPSGGLKKGFKVQEWNHHESEIIEYLTNLS